MDRKVDLVKVFNRFPTETQELKQKVHWIKQYDKVVMIIACQRKKSIVCLALKKGKYNTISIITRCDENITAPFTSYSLFQTRQIELTCIDKIKVTTDQKRVKISFKISKEQNWYLYFQSLQALNNWVSHMKTDFGMKKKQPLLFESSSKVEYEILEVQGFFPVDNFCKNEAKSMKTQKFLQQFQKYDKYLSHEKMKNIVLLRQGYMTFHAKQIQEMNNKLVKQINELQKQLQLGQKQHDSCLSKSAEQIKKQQESNKILTNSLNLEQQQRQKLKTKIAQIEEQNIKKDQRSRQLQTCLLKLKQETQQNRVTKDKQIKEANEQKTRNNQQISQLKQSLGLKESEILHKSQQLQQARRTIDELNSQLQQMSQTLSNERIQASEDKKQTEERITKLSKQISAQNSQMDRMTKQLKNAESIKQSNHQLISQLSEQRFYHIFEKDALHERNEEKMYLCQQIETLCGQTIKYSKLLCFFDPLNKVNFHLYIDEKPNICCVIRTETGHCLAGFSKLPFSKQNPAIDGGILVSLSNRRTYKCKEGKKAVNYDDFYAIFGNSQIRVRTGETELFSNLGIATSYYDCNGDKASDLIGDSKQRISRIKHYEFYEVIFK